MYDEWRASGKSQRSFAVFLGLSPTTLSLLLNGRIRTVTRQTAATLRQVLGDGMPEPPQLRGTAKTTNQTGARSPEWRQRM